MTDVARKPTAPARRPAPPAPAPRTVASAAPFSARPVYRCARCGREFPTGGYHSERYFDDHLVWHDRWQAAGREAFDLAVLPLSALTLTAMLVAALWGHLDADTRRGVALAGFVLLAGLVGAWLRWM